MDEEMLDEIFADLAADLVDLDDDQIKDRILKYGLSPEDMKEVFDTVKAVQAAESVADSNPDPLSLENADALADANTKEAKDMANEDGTSVKVTETDTDGDGDVDETTITKEEPENDTPTRPVTEEDFAELEKILSGDKGEGEAETKNSEPEGDKPHDSKESENKTNHFAKMLSEHRY